MTVELHLTCLLTLPKGNYSAEELRYGRVLGYQSNHLGGQKDICVCLWRGAFWNSPLNAFMTKLKIFVTLHFIITAQPRMFCVFLLRFYCLWHALTKLHINKVNCLCSLSLYYHYSSQRYRCVCGEKCMKWEENRDGALALIQLCWTYTELE